MIKISRSKLVPKVLVGLTVLLTIFGLITTANAGIPPFIWEYSQYNYIWGVDQTLPQDEPCFWAIGIACSEEEIETGYYPKPPFKHKLYIDGEEINLRRFIFTDKDGSMFGIPGQKWYFFYQVFEASYFTLGEYDVTEEFWVHHPYTGSETYGWRIFVNYEGPEYKYGPVGLPHTLTYTLTFV
ncbi:MAG: hypothetical protein ACFFCV_01680 [Promethearchaeota archaeon]